MLWQLVLFGFLVSIIYLVSRQLIQLLFGISISLMRNHKAAMWFLALILLPGTIVHELSHFFAAAILRVPTGKLSIFPSEGDKGEIRAGHLVIARTGPIRHTIIGVAPIMVGLIILYFLSSAFVTNPLQISNVFISYILFSISSTMFSSKSDMRSFIFVAPVAILLVTAVYLAGVRVTFTQNLQEIMIEGAKKLNFSLAQVGIIDTAVFLLLQMVVKTPRPKRPGLL